MKTVVCAKCGAATTIEDNEVAPVAFCVYCGSRLPDYCTSIVQISNEEDSRILECYVDAAENEIFGNDELAEKYYTKLLGYRKDFIPAQNGLKRLRNKKNPIILVSDMDPNPIEDTKKVQDNVIVKFNSVPPYYNILVDFDSGNERFKLNRGDVRLVTLSPGQTHTVSFNLGKRHYEREFYIRDADSFVEIAYLFNGVNHITINDG